MALKVINLFGSLRIKYITPDGSEELKEWQFPRRGTLAEKFEDSNDFISQLMVGIVNAIDGFVKEFGGRTNIDMANILYNVSKALYTKARKYEVLHNKEIHQEATKDDSL